MVCSMKEKEVLSECFPLSIRYRFDWGKGELEDDIDFNMKNFHLLLWCILKDLFKDFYTEFTQEYVHYYENYFRVID